jgi:hypothetical protein
MKLTKEKLNQIIKEEIKNVKEAWQQGLFGGEEEIAQPEETAPAEPWQQLEPLVRKTNSEFDKAYGLPMIRKFYKLHRNYAVGTPVPEITQIIPMKNKTIDIVFADRTQEVYTPYGMDVGGRY